MVFDTPYLALVVAGTTLLSLVRPAAPAGDQKDDGKHVAYVQAEMSSYLL